MTKRIAASLWWLGLALYLGGIVAIGLTVAPTLFQGVTEVGATLPHWPIPADSPRQLGGELFGRILLQFQWIEITAISLMSLGVILSGWKLIPTPSLAWAQRALLAVVGLIFIYDACLLTPEIFDTRDQWRQSVYRRANQATIDANRARFDSLHQRDEFVGHLKVWTLAVLAVVSSVGMTAPPDKESPSAA